MQSDQSDASYLHLPGLVSVVLWKDSSGPNWNKASYCMFLCDYFRICKISCKKLEGKKKVIDCSATFVSRVNTGEEAHWCRSWRQCVLFSSQELSLTVRFVGEMAAKEQNCMRRSLSLFLSLATSASICVNILKFVPKVCFIFNLHLTWMLRPPSRLPQPDQSKVTKKRKTSLTSHDAKSDKLHVYHS